jgi:hypothetical protein
LLDCLADAGRPVPLGEVYAAVYGTPLPVKKADRRAAINKLHRVRADAEAHLASAGRPERIETDPVTEGWALVPPFPDC